MGVKSDGGDTSCSKSSVNRAKKTSLRDTKTKSVKENSMEEPL